MEFKEEATKFAFMLLILIGILGLSLISFGITGKVVIDENVKPICSFNTNCSNGEVCCLFYNESAGVCHAQDMCDDILELTREEKSRMKELSSLLLGNLPVASKYIYSMILGFVITIFVGVFLYIIKKSSDKEEKRLNNNEEIK